MDGYTGEIRIFSGDFAPAGWAKCDGSRVEVNRFPRLFSVIDYYYGGSGGVFNLPDLRGRTPIGMNEPDYPIGGRGGSSTYKIDNIPKHTHQLFGVNKSAASSNPANKLAGTFNSRESYYATAPKEGKILNVLSVYSTGKESIGPPLPNEQPYMAVNYIICIEGTHPY